MPRYYKKKVKIGDSPQLLVSQCTMCPKVVFTLIVVNDFDFSFNSEEIVL